MTPAEQYDYSDNRANSNSLDSMVCNLMVARASFDSTGFFASGVCFEY